MRRPLRVATTKQLERSVRAAGFDTYLLPELPSLDFNRSIEERTSDGAIYGPFLKRHDIELVVDFNTSALTLVSSSREPGLMSLTTAELGISYVACYLDPITSTMSQVKWADHWHLLENPTWVKWIPETAHSDELKRLGIPNVLTMPMALADEEVDTSPLPEPDPGPVVSFIGHPASSWFRSQQTVAPHQLFASLTAAAVNADMPDITFQQVYYDLYQFGEPPKAEEDPSVRAGKAHEYFNQKFIYNAYLAVKQRDRFARFLKLKLGDNFELIGDHWKTNYGLEHTPRIWDRKVMADRMRRVPISLNLSKGNSETALNLRHFEITGYGGFMLTCDRGELRNCFEVGQECDVFHNEQELLEKIAHYLNHPKERREIAAAGQRRTLSDHLYSHRLQTLVTLLRKAGMLAATDASQPSPERTTIAESTTPDAADTVVINPG